MHDSVISLLLSHVNALQQTGHRRLLVLSGTSAWCQQITRRLQAALPGDWIAADVAADGPSSARQWLGAEYRHGVINAQRGLNVDTLAILAGTLKAGSLLVLQVPTWSVWPARTDEDSVRWATVDAPIATPHFVRYLQHTLETQREAILWRQHKPICLPAQPQGARWQPPAGQPDAEQATLLRQLLAARRGVFVLTAARGRGKSALAGMLIARWRGRCLVTAPARHSSAVIQRHVSAPLLFQAPDRLLADCQASAAPSADWLIVDEAAAIPLALLNALITYFPRVLLLTTTEGYEGTGRGFLLKFCASLPAYQPLTLQQPARWAVGDGLEAWLNRLLLLQPPPLPAAGDRPVHNETPTQARWAAEPARLAAFYALLVHAHYRTTPLDLRRMMDAPGQRFHAAYSGDALIGALWLTEEGGLSETLAHDVWAGRRRPRGNLVAQSLAAHGGEPEAAVLRSWRISRIAVSEAWRRRGIARQLIEYSLAQTVSIPDYLSVSFGYTAALGAFWQQCGFTLVRFSTWQEASSGCYGAMAVRPLSAAAQRLVARLTDALQRSHGWLSRQIPAPLPFRALPDGPLSVTDWRQLAGFAFAHVPAQACAGALCRLLACSPLPSPALRLWLQQDHAPQTCVRLLQLSGQKALLARWRTECAAALRQLDPLLCRYWQRWSQPAKTISDTATPPQ